jgi:hypothetical protein
LAESDDAGVHEHLLEAARILRALARGALGLNVEQLPSVGEWIARDRTLVATGKLPARKRTSKKGKPHGEKETR